MDSLRTPIPPSFLPARASVANHVVALGLHDPIAAPCDRERVDRCLRGFLAESRRKHASNALVRPLFGRVAEFVLNGGKRLRPRLTLACYRILASAESPPVAVERAAASLELFHAFMLVHDDLIDASLLRRDRPTLHEAIRVDHVSATGTDCRKRAGDLGLIGGDLLCALGMRQLSRSGLEAKTLKRALRFVSDMLLETGIGEALDVIFETCPLAKISEAQILDAYLRKTARYTVSGPLVLGAILAGADSSIRKSLRRFGDLIGIGYQIQNDLDGLITCGESSECPDLDSGKRTWLLWTAYHRLGDSGRRRIEATLEFPIGPERQEALRSLIESSGALEIARDRVLTLRRDAVAILRESHLNAAQRSAFLGLIGLISPQSAMASEARA